MKNTGIQHKHGMAWVSMPTYQCGTFLAKHHVSYRIECLRDAEHGNRICQWNVWFKRHIKGGETEWEVVEFGDTLAEAMGRARLHFERWLAAVEQED